MKDCLLKVKGSGTKRDIYIVLGRICYFYVWSGAKIDTYSVCFKMVNGDLIEEQYATEEEAIQRVNEVSNVFHVAYGRVKDGEIA